MVGRYLAKDQGTPSLLDLRNLADILEDSNRFWKILDDYWYSGGPRRWSEQLVKPDAVTYSAAIMATRQWLNLVSPVPGICMVFLGC